MFYSQFPTTLPIYLRLKLYRVVCWEQLGVPILQKEKPAVSICSFISLSGRNCHTHVNMNNARMAENIPMGKHISIMFSC